MTKTPFAILISLRLYIQCNSTAIFSISPWVDFNLHIYILYNTVGRFILSLYMFLTFNYWS